MQKCRDLINSHRYRVLCDYFSNGKSRHVPVPDPSTCHQIVLSTLLWCLEHGVLVVSTFLHSLILSLSLSHFFSSPSHIPFSLSLCSISIVCAKPKAAGRSATNLDGFFFLRLFRSFVSFDHFLFFFIYHYEMGFALCRVTVARPLVRYCVCRIFLLFRAMQMCWNQK